MRLARLVGLMTLMDVALFMLTFPRVFRRNTSLHCALFILIHRSVLVCVVVSCNLSTRLCLASSPCRLRNTLFTQAGADATNSVPLFVDPPLKVVRPGRFSSRRAEKERSREDCPYAWPGCRMYVQFRAQGACRLECIHRHSLRDLSVRSSSVLTSFLPRVNPQRRASTFLRPFPILGRRGRLCKCSYVRQACRRQCAQFCSALFTPLELAAPVLNGAAASVKHILRSVKGLPALL